MVTVENAAIDRVASALSESARDEKLGMLSG
jgi:hypothetical protein